MKKILSALTAFAMCFSMAAASLPASALSVNDVTAVSATAGWTWKLQDTVFDPATQDYAVIPITVTGDQGTYGFTMDMLVDGKSLEEAGFEVMDMSLTDAYSSMTFQGNDATGQYVATRNEANDVTVADGTTVMEIAVIPPDTTPGKVYTFTFPKFTVDNFARAYRSND